MYVLHLFQRNRKSDRSLDSALLVIRLDGQASCGFRREIVFGLTLLIGDFRGTFLAWQMNRRTNWNRDGNR